MKLEKFLGYHASFDPARELAEGESPEMLNFKITDGFGLKKREGYVPAFLAQQDEIRGIWYGKVGGEDRYLAAIGKVLYASATGFEDLSPLDGEVPGSEKVVFFPFYRGVYLLTGEGIKKYDGTDLLPLEPHVPLVMIATAPSGSGVVYEEPNILTNQIRQSFSPNGEDRIFFPALTNIQSVVWVKENGIEMDSSRYYWDDAMCAIVFLNPPIQGVDNLEVLMKMYTQDVSDRILNCRFAVGFGGASDTRAFLYGNRESPSMRYHSGIVEGEPSFEYFPETGYTFIGSGSPITSILRHYDRQLIFTEEAAYYSYLEYMTGESEKLIASFPVLPLSDDRGCVPEGQALLVENTPCTLGRNGLFRWVSTNIRDERNAVLFSEPIDAALQKETAERAILFNRKGTSELYLCFGSHLYVYNYRLGLFYYYEVSEIQDFCETENGFYFVSGKNIFRVAGDSDNGKEIPAVWRSKPLSFSTPFQEKNLYWLTLLSMTGDEAKVAVSFRRQNGEPEEERIFFLQGGEEQALLRLRCLKRRFQLLEWKITSTGSKPFSLVGAQFRGRITDGIS